MLTHCNAGRAGGLRLRLGAGRDSRGGRARQEDRCVCRRDAAVQPGHAADGVGAGEGQDSDYADLRQHGRLLHAKGRIQAVIVGADRIAANGDTANKIGTYSVSILAKEHGIPFYVAAPFNTIDLATAIGDLIPIEQRSAREVTHLKGVQVTPHGVRD